MLSPASYLLPSLSCVCLKSAAHNRHRKKYTFFRDIFQIRQWKDSHFYLQTSNSTNFGTQAFQLSETTSSSKLYVYDKGLGTMEMSNYIFAETL